MIFVRHENLETRGYIALVAVLISGAIMIIAALAATRTGVEGANTTSGYESSIRAQYLADTCAEEAIGRLKSNINYSGNETVNVLGIDFCNIETITGTGSKDREIFTSATVLGYVRHTKVSVANIAPLSIAEWVALPN